MNGEPDWQEYNLVAEPGLDGSLEADGEQGQEHCVLETRSDASPDREVGEGAEPGSHCSPPLAADGEHPSLDQVTQGESVGARVPDSDSEVESPQEPVSGCTTEG